MEPNYWSQTVTEIYGTEIKSSLRSCCKKQIFMLFSLGTGYFLETGDVSSVVVQYTTLFCSILDSMNDSALIMFHDFTVTGLV